MNVLFMIMDAHRADHMSCSGNPNLQTPNLDRLAKEGVRFTNHYCTNPICMPNRATLMTGLYPNVHGVRGNGINLREDLPTITQTLQKKGWHTVAIGKIHHQFWAAPYRFKKLSAENLVSWVDPGGRKDPVREKFPLPYYGYNEVELVSGNGSICSGHYSQWLEEKSPSVAKAVKKRVKNYDTLVNLFCDEIPEEFCSATYIKERTIAFLERCAKGTYGKKPEVIELPANFHDINNLYHHEFLGPHLKVPPFKKVFLRESTELEVRKFIALTYASVAYVDYCIGQILASLEKLGYSNNTIVVYMSDHGDLMGDHGLLLKGPSPFNGVLQLPLIWKIPGITKPGRISNSLVSSIDYPKTILSLLGIKERYHPPEMQGFDITPILKDLSNEIRDCCFIENDEEWGPLQSRVRHLVTKQYKLTVYENMPNFGDIYDRINDPLELNNLWYNEDFKEQKCELLNKMLHESLKAQSRYPKKIAVS
jgi:arylsulfatase A-like enzyme